MKRVNLNVNSTWALFILHMSLCSVKSATHIKKVLLWLWNLKSDDHTSTSRLMEVCVCVWGAAGGTGAGLGSEGWGEGEGPGGLWSSGNGRPRGPHLSLLQRRGPSPGSESLLLGVSASHTRDGSAWRRTTRAGVSVRGGNTGTLPGPGFIHWGPVHRKHENNTNKRGALVSWWNPERVGRCTDPSASISRTAAATRALQRSSGDFFFFLSSYFAILSAGVYAQWWRRTRRIKFTSLCPE